MCAALSSSAAKHVASRFGFHTVTESVHLVLRTLFGLIRSFHVKLPTSYVAKQLA